MNVLEWLKWSSRYNIEDRSYEKIAIDREISIDADAMTLTTEQKELLIADILFVALILSPSSTSSIESTHNNFSRKIGGESLNNERYLKDKAIMEGIYKKYGDARYEMLQANGVAKIKIIQIEDVI